MTDTSEKSSGGFRFGGVGGNATGSASDASLRVVVIEGRAR